MLWRMEEHSDSLQQLLLGSGSIRRDGNRWRLELPEAPPETYGDAQLHDYGGLRRGDFRWRAPLWLSVRARLSPEIHGTAGLGLWNNPLSPLGGLPALPQAAWFLWASPPSNMALAWDVPGHGWKAATIDAGRWQALMWAPFAPLVLLACRLPSVRRVLWPWVQQSLAIDEVLLDFDWTAWHTYDLWWLRGRVVFGVDGHRVLVSRASPRGPLGLVIWVDNQWARVTPAGSFGWGLLEVRAPQWMEIEEFRIVRG